MRNTSPAIKVLAIICISLTMTALFLAYLTPSRGYETSIYDSTPAAVWAFLVASVAGSLLILLHEAYTGRYKSSSLWLTGVFILLVDRLSILYIPFIRGYYTWDGDNIVHLGILIDILSSHHVSGDVVYPITHILLAELCSYTNLPVLTIVNYSTGILSALMTIYILLLAMMIFKSKKNAILAFAATAGVFLLYGYEAYLMPNGWSIMLLPLVIYIMLKESYQYRILLLLMLVVYPFFHPLSALLLIVIVVMYMAARIVGAWFSGGVNGAGSPARFLAVAAIFGVIAFTEWVLSSNIFYPNISLAYTSIVSHVNINAVGEISQSMSMTKLDLPGLVLLIVKKFGQEMLYVIITLAGLIVLAYHKVRYGRLLAGSQMLFIYAIIVLFSLLYACYLLNVLPQISVFGADRLMAYMALFTPLGLVAFFSYFRGPSGYTAALLFGIIIVAGVISILNIYPSPNTFEPNTQVTSMDMTGMSWFIDYKYPSTQSAYVISPPFRHASGIIGTQEQKARSDLQFSARMPDHFLYNTNYSMSQYFNGDLMLVSRFERSVYSGVWKQIGRYTDQDYARLANDSTVQELYDNGELNAYYIL